jgi:hypothetical protein
MPTDIKIPWRLARVAETSTLVTPKDFPYHGDVWVEIRNSGRTKDAWGYVYTSNNIDRVQRWSADGITWHERKPVRTRTFDELPDAECNVVLEFENGSRRVWDSIAPSQLEDRGVVAWCYLNEVLAALPAPEGM